MTSTQTPTRVKHTIHLLPPDTTLNEQDQITSALHSQRPAFTYSADAAHAIVHAGNTGSEVVIWSGARWTSGDIFDWFKQKGVNTSAREFDGSTPPHPGHIFSGSPTSVAAPIRIEHTIHLIPQNITLAEVKAVTTHLHPNRSAFTYSADAAHALIHAGNEKSKVVVWSGERWSADIFAWLNTRGIAFSSERIDAVNGSTFIFTHWPTDHKRVIQKFNVNPQNYTFPGLTGHDGLDIQAPIGSKIYAAAAGTVYKIRQVAEGHNYGMVVYLQHQDGFRSAYAHLQSVENNVKNGTAVSGGQLLGRADSTGNVWPKDNPAAASHLHLTLYNDGASARGETPMDFDIIDPTPYIQHLLTDDNTIEDVWEPPKEPLIKGWGFVPGLEVRGVLAKVSSSSYINLRAGAGTDQPLIGRVNNGVVVKVTNSTPTNNYLPLLITETDVNRTRAHSNLEIGMHNENGAQWMLNNGIKGWALHTIAIGSGGAVPVNAAGFEATGIKLLVRLNYGYGSTGNIPKDDDPNYESFIKACVQTIKRSIGVWGFIFGNETNNSNEFPGNHNGQGGEPITPERYARLYNRIKNRIPATARFGPQAVDPYFDPKFILNIDSRDYWLRILNNISGADFLTVHPKTQDSNPDSIDSSRTFGPGPLSWQFYHMRAYQPLLDAVPARFRGLPVIATEVNPQRHNDMKTLGWQENLGSEWVKRVVNHFKLYNQEAAMPVAGLIFYRFSSDDWELQNKPGILQAIKSLA
jgi:hypothetical protein